MYRGNNTGRNIHNLKCIYCILGARKAFEAGIFEKVGALTIEGAGADASLEAFLAERKAPPQGWGREKWSRAERGPVMSMLRGQ